MKTQRNKKAVRRTILSVVVLLLIGYIFCLPKVLFLVPYSTIVEDRHGELLGARIADDGQWRFPPGNTVPHKMEICLLRFEDRYFYRHWGVNPLAMGRAFYQNMKEKRIVSGGSTITMQTIRLARNKPRTWCEKFVEAIWATRLEFRYSKKKILSLYASHAPFGGNVVGLNAASWRYFNCAPEQLSWSESATLAVLPNAPSMIHLSKQRSELLKKRNRLLTYLYDDGILDTQDYQLALSEPLPDEPYPLPQIAPHLVDRFHQHQKGKKLASTIEKGIQIQVEAILRRWNGELQQSGIHNIAAIVIDVQTNQVLAYCGNVHFNQSTSSNQVDIIRSPRSTGSILKPFLFCAMLQEGEILPNTLVPDIPVNINGFSPQNFNLQYEGAVRASEAISRSLNIPSVQILRQYSVPKFYGLLKNAGISTLHKPSSHYGLSLILGGAEATLWDISSVYTDMARSLSGLGNTNLQVYLNEEKNNSKKKTVFLPGSVWQTFEVLKEVNRPEEIDWRTIPSMQKIAWKTGTSYGFRDAWAVGVTPQYVVGVWVGNASGEGKPGLVGARTAGPVMFDIFNLLPSSSWFKIPYSEFIDAEVCPQSGNLKGRFCENTDSVLILPTGLKTQTCPYHHPVNLTKDGSHRIHENCIEDEEVVQRSWFSLPPAWEWYYKQQHPEYKQLPPFKKGCGESGRIPMQFIYPQMNAHISRPKQIDGEQAPITFELAHSNRDAIVFWHLDNSYIVSTQDFHKISLNPSPGNHSMTVVDNESHSLSIRFFIED